MNKEEIPFLSATQLGSLIQQKEISVVEVVEAYLDRIDGLNHKLNAYITVCAEEAIQAANRAQDEIAKGHYKGPMHGIPVAVKDLVFTKGIRTTGGSRLLENFVPDEDATVISKLKLAGAIVIGKANHNEFACGVDIHRGLAKSQHPYGVPRNPWKLDRLPGASSSGSAAATAAFLCASSLGSDTGGSIRGPSSMCGLVGMRPTWGRVSQYGIMGQSWSMDATGPMSRTVEDCAMTLETIAGYDSKDPFTWKTSVPNYSQLLGGGIKGLKVGVIKERIDSSLVQPDIREAVDNAIAVLQGLGAEIEEVSIPLTVHSWIISVAIALPESVVTHRDRVLNHLDEISDHMRWRLRLGSLMPAQAYYKAQRLRTVIRQQVLDALDKVDVLVTPMSAVTAMPVPLEDATPTVVTKESEKAGLYDHKSFSAPFNLAGVPAASVPCGFSAEGLPMGFQIAGKPMDEATVFKVGYAYQQSTPWHNRKPPI